MVKSVTHIRVGLEVKHHIASAHGPRKSSPVKNVALEKFSKPAAERLREKLAPPGAKVVENSYMKTLGHQMIHERAANEARPAGD